MSKNGHNVDTLKDLMDAELRRVDQKFKDNDKAVEIALDNSKAAGKTVNIVSLVSVVAGIASVLSLILAIAALFIHH